MSTEGATTVPGAADLTERVDALTRFAAELRFEDLPADVVAEAKARVLDLLGCILGGTADPSSQMVVRVLHAWGGVEQAVVVGTGTRLPAAHAAFCNGAAGHALELEDDHKPGVVHPGVCVIPAALAVGECLGASGREVLTAIVAGYEIMCRVAEAARPHGLLRKGFHPTGVCGVFGTATAAARLAGLSPDRLRAALGIAGSFAAGLFEFVNDGSLVKRLHPGNAAKSGILAAQLAAQGYSGPRHVLEGRLGFFNAFSGDCSPEPLVQDLGRRFEIARTSYKRHACCSYSHPLLDALLELTRATPLDAREVRAVVGRTFTDAARLLGDPLAEKQSPSNPVDAQFSAPYCLAVALADGQAMPAQFTPARLRDPEVRDLARRVRIEIDPAFDRVFPGCWPAEVVIETRDGRTYRHEVSVSKGDPRWPLSPAELETKFFTLTRETVAEARARAIRDAVSALDGCRDVRELARLLALP